MKPGEETLGEASQMLRDILQSKEKNKQLQQQQQQQQQKQQLQQPQKQQQNEGDNNNTLKTNFDNVTSESPHPALNNANNFCTASESDTHEMMNSMLRGKSSSSKANSDDNDGQSETYNNLSGDESDLDSAYGPMNCSGDDVRKEHDDEGDERDESAASPSADNFSSSDTKEAKRARVENILTSIRQSPQAGYETLAQSTYEMKRQKRKQAQPQQHDVRSLLAPESKYRKMEHMVLQEHIRQLQEQLHAVKRSFNQMSSSHCGESDDDVDKDTSNGCDDLENEDQEERASPLQENNFLRASLRDKDVTNSSPSAVGLSPRGVNARDEVSPLSSSTPFRFNGKPLGDGPGDVSHFLKGKDGHGLKNGGFAFPGFPHPPAGFPRVPHTLKTELIQAVTQAVVTAVSTVLEKDAGPLNDQQQPPTPVKAEVQNQQQREQREPREPQQQREQQQQQQQQQQREQQQQQGHSQKHQELFPRPLSAPRPRPEREALKETVSNSQTLEGRGSDLVVPYPDHLNFLERFSSNRLPEKTSAFEPLHHRLGSDSSDLIRPHTSSALAFPPHYPYSFMHAGLLPPVFPVEPEQTEALPLVVSNMPKKKRTKVTDTRLSPRAKSALLHDSPVGIGLPGMMGEMPVSGAGSDGRGHPGLPSPFPHPYLPPVLPTSVAITNPSLHRSDLFNFRFHDMYESTHMASPPVNHDRGSPKSPTHDSMQSLLKSDVFDTSASESMDGQATQKTCTLTPMHLRKAKLMFFHTRYPNSGILKIYFPDVSFNKNNTAQLVKWFSNFREFFYIQMEKYARQSIADGCTHSEDLVVSRDSELYRHLNLHYNRNNQIEVPESFRQVVQATLREFFKAVYSKKDTESSWKKAIYKVIARLDEPLPEYFKSANWMDQLGEA